MPKLSDTMTEGVVAKWHKNVGDNVESGELLADIETDKATMEFESFQDGVLLYKGIEEGQTAKVDSVLAVFGKKGEDISKLLEAEQNGNGQANIEKTEAAKDVGAKMEKKHDQKAVAIAKPDVKANIVRMPKLSDTMTEGVVAKWHKNVGDKVSNGELLAEIETDKATMEFESFEDGVLLYRGVEEGGNAPVDSILAIIGEKGADYKQLIAYEEANAGVSEEPVSEQKTAESRKEVVAEKAPEPQLKTQQTHITMSANGSRVKASPLAKKLAEEKGISLNGIQGTGDGGRIIKRDVENYNGQGFAPAVMQESYREVPVSQMRKTIARRLAESKFTAPHFYLTISIDMEAAFNARKSINEIAPVKISFNDLVIRAVALSLKKHPQVNAAWQGDTIRYNDHVHVGVAVAVEDGLLVPVVKFADGKRLTQISEEVKTFAEKAKNKQLQPEDWEGNTFTISNLGMFGIEEFTAIINPPDSCIMAVGGISDVPVVKNGQIVPGKVMKVTLSCDHRVVDGATGSQFLQTFKQYLENPVLLLGEATI